MITVLATPQELLVDKYKFPFKRSYSLNLGIYSNFSSTPVMWKYFHILSEQKGIKYKHASYDYKNDTFTLEDGEGGGWEENRWEVATFPGNDLRRVMPHYARFLTINGPAEVKELSSLVRLEKELNSLNLNGMEAIASGGGSQILITELTMIMTNDYLVHIKL